MVSTHLLAIVMEECMLCLLLTMQVEEMISNKRRSTLGLKQSTTMKALWCSEC
jgi:hypothetical protein